MSEYSIGGPPTRVHNHQTDNTGTIAYAALTSPPYDYAATMFNDTLKAATFDPAACSGTFTPVAATIYLNKIPIIGTIVFTNLIYQITTLGSTLTNCWVGLYNSAGTLLTSSPAQTTTWTTTGQKTTALTTPQTLTGPGFVWAAFQVGSFAAAPVFRQANSGAATLYNAGTSVATSRAGSIAGANAALPDPIVPANISQAAAQPVWFGVT